MEGSESKLNDLRNDANPNAGGWGWLDATGRRYNSTILNINVELFEPEYVPIQEPTQPVIIDDGSYSNNYPEDTDGLTISSDAGKIAKQTSHPYGYDSPPARTFNNDPKVRGYNQSDILTFESFSKLYKK